MTPVDIIVVAVYVLGIAALGWFAGRSRKMESVADFFLAGRSFAWWAVGTSMVATTVAADTPLAVAGITINDGVAGNWFWWAFIGSHVLVSVVLGRLWRRAEIVTDAELVELRYVDRAAPFLRGFKAFYFAVPINCIVMGFVFLAMIKVSAALLPEIPTWQVIGILLVLTLLYSLRSGYAAVVLTDLVQFPIALGGAIVLAVYAVDAAGGLDAVVDNMRRTRGDDAVAMFPVGTDSLPWHAIIAFLGVQWWAHKGSDGGGIFVQRLSSARTERDAEQGGLWFMVCHYVLRPWPWILTGMAATVLLPDMVGADAESTYPQLIVEVLPPGLRGLLVAAFLAAFMSTIDTHLNWGASYLVNDLLARFGAVSPERIGLASRLSVIGLAGLALVATATMDTIRGAWEFVIAFSAGAGATILLRWYWWRITAATEVAAMAASTVLSIVVYAVGGDEWTYLDKLAVIVPGSAAVWIPVALLTTPKPERLHAFYRRVRPVGPGWRRVAEATGSAPPGGLGLDLLRWGIGVVAVSLALFGAGAAFTGEPARGIVQVAAGLVLMAWLGRTSPGAGKEGSDAMDDGGEAGDGAGGDVGAHGVR